MENIENIYKYVGLAVIAFFTLYIVLKIMNLQVNILEGMTSNTSSSSNTTPMDKLADSIKNNTNMIENKLLISKYRKSYEDIIIDLETNINLYILSGLATNAETISANPLSPESQTIITSINAMKLFKDTLNDAMITLDKTK
jgi:hypothetical protein